MSTFWLIELTQCLTGIHIDPGIYPSVEISIKSTTPALVPLLPKMITILQCSAYIKALAH